MKTKVKFLDEVGYIDGYVNANTSNGDVFALVVIGNKIKSISIGNLEVIDEATFKKEDQNTFITLKTNK